MIVVIEEINLSKRHITKKYFYKSNMPFYKVSGNNVCTLETEYYLT